jgi:hypothetical protein
MAEFFFEILQGLPGLAQLIGFHKLPHLHLHRNCRSAGQARNASAANEHRRDASLPGVLFSFVQARSGFREPPSPLLLQFRFVDLCRWLFVLRSARR